MKKLIFFLMLTLVSTASIHAQSATAFPLAAGDTLTCNGTVGDTVFKKITVTAGYAVAGVQVLLNKTSGTVAGKAYLFQSMDGTNYQITDSSAYTAMPAWSYTTATYTHSALFNKASPPSVNYVVAAACSGTVTAPVKILYTLRKTVITQ